MSCEIFATKLKACYHMTRYCLSRGHKATSRASQTIHVMKTRGSSRAGRVEVPCDISGGDCLFYTIQVLSERETLLSAVLLTVTT